MLAQEVLGPNNWKEVLKRLETIQDLEDEALMSSTELCTIWNVPRITTFKEGKNNIKLVLEFQVYLQNCRSCCLQHIPDNQHNNIMN